MDRSHLLREWSRKFGHPPGAYISVQLMRSMLSFDAQASLHGGQSGQAARTLLGRARQLKLARDGDTQLTTKSEDRPSLPFLRPGVQLMREWNGRTYRVEVVDDGFMMDGTNYRSLTAIARQITGAHWSGPRFFGLTSR